jgi:hypothetical protein
MKRASCKKCGGALRDSVAPNGHKLRYCPVCHSAAKRLWKSAHPGATRAHRVVSRALAKGAITRGPCEVCGDVRTEAHHPNGGYDLPLAVTWLCKTHHRGLHAALRRAAR